MVAQEEQRRLSVAAWRDLLRRIGRRYEYRRWGMLMAGGTLGHAAADQMREQLARRVAEMLGDGGVRDVGVHVDAVEKGGNGPAPPAVPSPTGATTGHS